jgi:hypothetical protein
MTQPRDRAKVRSHKALRSKAFCVYYIIRLNNFQYLLKKMSGKATSAPSFKYMPFKKLSVVCFLFLDKSRVA